MSGAGVAGRGWTRAVVLRGLTWGALWGAVGGAGLVLLLFGLGSWFSAAGLDATTVLSGVLVGVLVGAAVGAVALGAALALLVVADRRGAGRRRPVQVAAVAVAALVPAVAVRLLLALTMGVLVAQAAALVAGLAALVVSAALLRRLVAMAS